MFKEVRRKDRSLEEKATLELLKRGEYGILSMVGANGYGYGIPLNYTLIDNCIYFHCAIEGFKLDNINKNNKVSFCVVGQTQLLPEKFSTKYESALAFGKAYEVYNEEKDLALKSIIEKYSPEYVKEGIEYIKRSSHRTKVIKIQIENISGKIRK